MVVMKGKKLLLNKWIRLMPPTQHHDRILRVSAADGYVEAPSFMPPQAKAMVFHEESSDEEVEPPVDSSSSVNGVVVEVIDVVELMKDLEDAELRDLHSKVNSGNRENVGAALCFIGSDKVEESDKTSRSLALGRVVVSKHSMSPFTKVISNFQLTPFGPKHIGIRKELAGANPCQMSPKTRYKDGAGEIKNPLSAFEGRCPPGGSNSVILYTTSLRGIPKTYEDCCSIRYILDSFGVKYYTRDVSMHTAYKEELRCILNGAGMGTIPPRLFIRGRYIGGAAEVRSLHGHCKLRPLFLGIPTDEGQGHCNRCRDIGFVLCSKCHGSRRIIASATTGTWTTCPGCNENGLAVCLSCS